MQTVRWFPARRRGAWLLVTMAGCGLVCLCLNGCSAPLAGAAADQNLAAEQGAALDEEVQQPDDDREVVNLLREIEEADIVKQDGSTFYIVNPYKGLQIIDAQYAAAPVLLGRLALGGRGVEMFLRETTAFVFTSADFFYCAGRAVGFGESEFDDVVQPGYDGSRLWIVDVSDPANPATVDMVDFEGFVTATRRVDDVIYAAGEFVAWDIWDGVEDVDDDQEDADADDPGEIPDDDDACPEIWIPVCGIDGVTYGNECEANVAGVQIAYQGRCISDRDSYDPGVDILFGVFVTSINITDPAQAFAVETERFGGSALDIHVSAQAMYILGDDPNLSGVTLVTYVDISDPAGDIVPRDQFRVPGIVQNRFFADEWEGAFRIITEARDDRTWTTEVEIYTYDVTDPDNIVRLGDANVISGESLRAVRFDGDRGYAVTFLQIDPLFILDLSDPEDPAVTGELEVPGFSTHLVPLDDQLVGVGFDNTNGVRPAVALYDVSDPAAPTQLARIIVGEEGSYGTMTEATVDEKALKVLQDAGLILLPFSSYDQEAGEYVDYLQIIGLGADSLSERGVIDHRGLVRRAGLLDESLWILSDLAFQTVDIADLDAPVSLARVDITSEQELLDGGLLNCVDSARWRGTELTGMFFEPWGNDVWMPGYWPGCPMFSSLLLALTIAGAVATRPRKP